MANCCSRGMVILDFARRPLAADLARCGGLNWVNPLAWMADLLNKLIDL